MKQGIILLVFIAVLQAFATQTINGQTQKKEVKNVILFIGDGMGTAHVYGAITASDHKLFLELFPYTGFSKTYSFNNYVTDSGAGGTAIACGVKTKNGMIGMNPDSVPVNSILEIAHRNGLATGIVVTSSVTDATPASFIAHNISRGNQENIAVAYLSGSVDVFMGGGEDYFRHRTDSVDLTQRLRKQGFDVEYNLDTLLMSKSNKLAGLFANGDMPGAREGRAGMLSRMTGKAIETLSRNKNGFFLIVEGSQIDKKSHLRNFPAVLTEVLDLDDAIGRAKEFADANRQTLIVVTADHETGGLTLINGNISKNQVAGTFIESGYHTGVMVPIFSYGPGANGFSGIHENTFFFYRILSLLGLNR
jgi:alkaline phosphatase